MTYFHASQEYSFYLFLVFSLLGQKVTKKAKENAVSLQNSVKMTCSCHFGILTSIFWFPLVALLWQNIYWDRSLHFRILKNSSLFQWLPYLFIYCNYFSSYFFNVWKNLAVLNVAVLVVCHLLNVLFFLNMKNSKKMKEMKKILGLLKLENHIMYLILKLMISDWF